MASPELAVRMAAMDWLNTRPNETVDFAWLSQFEFDGERIALMDRQRGIRKPRQLSAALAIRTVFTPPGSPKPYDDDIGPDGLQRYKYRGDNPDHPENVALRRAYLDQLPIIWFVGAGIGQYEPIYPVWVIADDRQRLEFTVFIGDDKPLFAFDREPEPDTRSYMERLTRQRLHQRVFRAEVLHAYEGRCTVCNLGHAQLIDAAHIVGDGLPLGQPVVNNGLAMCKIHHAAFDSRILGIRPDDLTVHIRQDILDEVDGPMLRHGLQDMHGQRLMKLPRSRSARPDHERLESRYADFLLS